MFVVTADQVRSRSTTDRVGKAVADLNREYGKALVLPADRTAGDELQLLAATGSDTLKVCLALSRGGGWSIGCGVGTVNHPLPAGVRESAGGAFVAARAAVDLAKRRPSRFALVHESDAEAAADAQSLLDLLLILRSRRSEEGWELYDLLDTGLTQAEAAARLGITPQAVSKRALVAELRAERAAIAPLSRVLERLDRP